MQVDFGAGAGSESDQSLHLSAHPHHYDPQGNNGSPVYSPFRHPVVPPIDPSLDQSAATNRNGHAPMSSVQHNPNSHLLQANNASHHAHPFYADMPRQSATPSTPSNASPRFSAISPSQAKQMMPSFVPEDRSAPPRDVTDETIDDAYAAFILYCNPMFATDIDTSELTKLFRTPPKSDGKAFSTWNLFELIRKFEIKEIKTWTQLALDLGVEPPDTDKGQSTQKVQQYSVRLKRWMHAMHIDAFFEYLLGKQHSYYLQVPPPHDPFPENGRDGVPLEEDLAIRALDPKFRPKRGRRKAEDGDDVVDSFDSTPPRKRPQLDTSIPFGNALQPQSAYPNSAHPDNMDGFLSAHDWQSAITPSSAMTAASAPSRLNPGGNKNQNLTPYSASPMSGQQLRWRLNTETPSTPHPLSAVTPQSAHPGFFDEPQSAITPSSSKARSRRRHGPAVSSAWPSNNTSSTGKLRGRPPSNRSVRDGPFVTFPANPKNAEHPFIDMNRNKPGNLTPIVERAQSDPPMAEQHFRFPPTPASAVSPTTMQDTIPTPQSGQERRPPHRLSLQVPQNVGNPVRLVTPTVLVNGEQDPTPSTGMPPSSGFSTGSRRSEFFGDENEPQSAHPGADPAPASHPQHPPPPSMMQTPSSPSSLQLPQIRQEALNRALAAELIRAPLTGRRKRLRGTEAKNLASAILRPLFAKPTTTAGAGKVISDQILGIAISSCLGMAAVVGLGAGGPNGGVRRVECIRFRVGGDGYESPIDDDEDGDEGGESGRIRESFDISFGVSFGGLTGEWTVKGLSVTANEHDANSTNTYDNDRQDTNPNTAQGWKTKFLEAQRKLWESQDEAKSLKEKILEVVL
ncbi:ARS binding protein 2-domain-containing protein [Clohesyomyces aquaticus]|uniref:ARS binding protein 2-domain-containing protein n=1 Tax=Clohesyomyces aquaticus TaxID=1231657 RepID=A0A1Y1YA35_9PLEO|nr:ARS binding protein 2-domain-containing protein [Clohesyomyces aquaticus]